MNVVFSLAVATLFGTGIYLVMKNDLLRNLIGITLASNAIIVFIVSAGVSRGQAPIHPLDAQAATSDPLVQALALTAVVINFGASMLVMSLIYRVYLTHRSLDQETLREAEKEDVSRTEQSGSADAGI